VLHLDELGNINSINMWWLETPPVSHQLLHQLLKLLVLKIQRGRPLAHSEL